MISYLVKKLKAYFCVLIIVALSFSFFPFAGLGQPAVPFLQFIVIQLYKKRIVPRLSGGRFLGSGH